MHINKKLSPDSKNNVRNFESGLEKAFTLVELIVVITILAILGTIAFISLQGYSRDARDSKRMTDLGNIKTSLELYSLKTGNFPKPDSFSTITYSGGTENVWFQGNVGDQVTTNLKSLNEKPLDPLTNDPYTYSVTQSYGEYEVLALYEGSVAYNQSPHSISPKGREVASIFPQVNAATTSLTPKIVGNYNGVFVKTPNYIIPTPSIITSAPPVSGTLRLDINNNILPPAPVSSSCNVLLGLGYTTDGMYTIDPDGAGPVPSFSTYCDMTTDGGGWTLVSMERLNGTSVDGAVGNIGTFTSLNQTTSFKVSDLQWRGIPHTIGTKIINKAATFYVKYGTKSWASSADNGVYGTNPIPSCSSDGINWPSSFGRAYHIADCYGISTGFIEMFYAIGDGTNSINCSTTFGNTILSNSFACGVRSGTSGMIKTSWVK